MTLDAQHVRQPLQGRRDRVQQPGTLGAQIGLRRVEEHLVGDDVHDQAALVDLVRRGTGVPGGPQRMVDGIARRRQLAVGVLGLRLDLLRALQGRLRRGGVDLPLRDALRGLGLTDAGGGYLKVGVALQLTADVAENAEPDGSKATDLIISTFSGARPADVTGARDALKAALQKKIIDAYKKDGAEVVMGIYYTDYVTQ